VEKVANATTIRTAAVEEDAQTLYVDLPVAVEKVVNVQKKITVDAANLLISLSLVLLFN